MPNWNDVRLTNREKEIILAMCSLESKKAIAGKLGIGIEKLKYCIKEIFGKLGVRDQLELILFVAYQGMAKEFSRQREHPYITTKANNANPVATSTSV